MDESVRVLVRVRPKTDKELEANEENALYEFSIDDAANNIHLTKKKSEEEIEREFKSSYDCIFPSDTGQCDVFASVENSIRQVVQGYNCTIFAYGQTGTGKTYTMIGKTLDGRWTDEKLDVPSHLDSVKESWGVIPRSIETLFAELHEIGKFGATAKVQCSFVQVYNNEVFDLLHHGTQCKKRTLAVREMMKGTDKQVYVSGLSEFRVTSLHETLELINLGNRNRTVRATELNEESSRSHALFQITIEVESKGAESVSTVIRRAKLNLVDLAGSEKWDTSNDMSNARKKELTNINQSLSALGNVISALADRKRKHIPYRNSKLTRLLQDSLGGNAYAILIATVSPSEVAFEETISTLQFADRAKNIKMRVRVNEVVDDSVLLAQAQCEIARLKLLLKQSSAPDRILLLESKVRSLSREKEEACQENQKLRSTVASLRKQLQRQVSDTGSKYASSEAASAHTMDLPNESHADSVSYTSQLDLHALRAEVHQDAKPREQEHTISLAPSKSNVEVAKLHDAEERQKQMLEEIRAQRRNLERKLDAISNRANLVSSRLNQEVDDVELCPICSRAIDDHTDTELDACIDAETEMISSRASTAMDVSPEMETSSSAKKGATPEPSGIVSPRGRRRLVNGAGSRSNPYLQIPHNIKPWTPHGLRRKSISSQRSSSDTSQDRNQEDRQHESSNKTLESQVQKQRRATFVAPIVHNGHKSVKALKKLYGKSRFPTHGQNGPPLLPHQAFASSASSNLSNNRTEQAINASHESLPGISGRLAHSTQDIGTKLSVYTFRYDCWYTCTVLAYDGKRKLHCCQYEYGDKQWQDLRERSYKVLHAS